ncbi:MAG: chemotaxis protein CheW [Deltaproteobacteria bacterium]|nr:MAG: chemotaxis protein CheW [Deltaproteobacteria bacterium]
MDVTSTGQKTVIEDSMQLVGFSIGTELFGVEILKVREIIRDAAITSIPNSPAFVEGVINLRGNIIPVIDLRKRLNLLQKKAEEDEEKVWILILEIEGRITGFRVDSVTKVLKILTKTIEPPPEIVTAGLESQYIDGVCEIDERLLILLNFGRILHTDEIKHLKAMAE